MWRILNQSLAIQKSISIFLGSCHHYQWNIDFVICIQIFQHDINFILWCINKIIWGRFPHVTHNGCSSCPAVPKLMPLFPKVTYVLKTEVCFLPSVNLGRYVEYMNYIHLTKSTHVPVKRPKGFWDMSSYKREKECHTIPVDPWTHYLVVLYWDSQSQIFNPPSS